MLLLVKAPQQQGLDNRVFEALVSYNKAFRHVEFLYQTEGKQTLLLAEMNHVIHFS